MKDGRLQSAARAQQSERLQPDNVAGRCAGDPARRTGGIAIDADGWVYTTQAASGAETGVRSASRSARSARGASSRKLGSIDREEVDAFPGDAPPPKSAGRCAEFRTGIIGGENRMWTFLACFATLLGAHLTQTHAVPVADA